MPPPFAPTNINDEPDENGEVVLPVRGRDFEVIYHIFQIANSFEFYNEVNANSGVHFKHSTLRKRPARFPPEIRHPATHLGSFLNVFRTGAATGVIPRDRKYRADAASIAGPAASSG